MSTSINNISNTPDRLVSYEKLDYREYMRHDVKEAITFSDIILRNTTYFAEKLTDAIGDHFKHQLKHIVFIHGYDGAPSGAIGYGNDERVLFYVESALIGYQGSGPMLTKKLLFAFGLDESVFNTLNDLAAHYPYYALALHI